MMPACSVTRIRSGWNSLALGTLPQKCRYALPPASSNSRLLHGEVHTICVSMLGRVVPLPLASEVVVALPLRVHPTHRIWSPTSKLTLLRAVGCHVSRSPLLIQY